MFCQKVTHKRAKKDEEKSGGNVDFSEVSKDGRLLQSDEG